MRSAAKGLHTLLPSLDVVACSPLVRARQTAQILADVYGKGLAITPLPALSPGKQPRCVVDWLREQPLDATVALIGHEPDLGRLMGWLLNGRKMSFTHFKKGAATLIEFTQTPRASDGMLVWLLTATHLAKFG